MVDKLEALLGETQDFAFFTYNLGIERVEFL
jgi:hypothetical protein